MTIDTPTLHRTAMLANMAYQSMPPKGRIYSWGNAQVLLYEHNDVLWIAIRGTNDIGDLLDDISCIRHPFWHMNMHKGFHIHAQACYNAIGDSTEYADALRHGKDIIITGHSLGGAAAVILPLIDPHMASRGRVQHIITYGAPRPFNGGTNPLSHPFYGKILRIVRPMDLVPDVPLWGKMRNPLAAPLSGWSHIGNEMYLSNGSLTEEGPSRIWNGTKRSARYLSHLPYYLLKRVLHAWTGRPRPKTLIEQDHSMENYLREIYTL